MKNLRLKECKLKMLKRNLINTSLMKRWNIQSSEVEAERVRYVDAASAIFR